MMVRILGVAAIALALLGSAAPVAARSHATPTPSPTPAPVADPAVTKLARQQFVAWQAGMVNKDLYVPEVQVKMTDAKIADVSHALSQLGALTNTVYVGPILLGPDDAPEGSRGFIYQMQCIGGNVYLFMIVTADGKVGSVYFKDRLDTETVKVAPTPETPTPSPPPPNRS